MADHIIHKQKVIIRMSNMESAFHYQNVVNNLFSNGLPGSIEKLLDEINVRDEVVRIDNLYVDIGTIDKGNFEKEFVNKFLEELKKSILEAKNEQSSNTTIFRPSESFRNGFIYFIENGILPWYIGAKNRAEFEAGMMNNWEKKDWNIVAEQLRNSRNDKIQISKRLVWQFSDNFLKEIFSSLLKQTISETVWESLLSDLDYIYNNSNNNKKQFLKDHLIEVFNRSLSQNNTADLENLIAGQLLDEFRNKQEWVLKYYEPISGKVQTGFIATILKNSFFMHKNNIPFQNITARDLLLKDKSIFQKILKKDKAKEMNFDKESKLNLSEDLKPKSHQIEEDETLFVKNCGIIILNPFLQHFFEEMNLLEENNFKDEQSSHKAALLLHYLATGQTEAAEFDLTIPKILCNIEIDQPVPDSMEFTEQELNEATNVLNAVLQHWTSLKGTSIEGLRTAFLDRTGKLSKTENGWKLSVEHKTLDILLDNLPWGISTLKLPWMKYYLNVEWP
ncbi:MAG: contractile injection system tape measure protein [Ginsengibacter sp.]